MTFYPHVAGLETGQCLGPQGGRPSLIEPVEDNAVAER